jgi:hypothetical protein
MRSYLAACARRERVAAFGAAAVALFVVLGLSGAIVAKLLVDGIDFDALQRQEMEDRRRFAEDVVGTFDSPEMLSLRQRLDNEDWCARYGYVEVAGGAYQPLLSDYQIAVLVDYFDFVDDQCFQPGSRGRTQPLCERDYVEQQMRAYAADLHGELSKYILDQRAQHGPTYGHGIASLADDNEPLERVATRYAYESCGVTSRP